MSAISNHARSCLRQLDELEKLVSTRIVRVLLPSVFVRGMQDGNARFKVWAGNIAAHKTGTSSLEYRLRDSSHISRQVLKLLEELSATLKESKAIISGESRSFSLKEVRNSTETTLDEASTEDSDDLDSELEQIAAEVADIVDCLLRLSMSIRNPAPHDRFFNSRQTDTSHFEEFDIQHVQSKFEFADSWLAERLGKAISRRRQYFKYREAHRQRLAHNLDGTLDVGAAETIASSLPENLKDHTQLPEREQPVMAFEENRSTGGASETSYATSKATEGDIRVPTLPRESEMGPFECPFCYMIIKVSDRNSWKKHVYGDLRPYICLEPDCESEQTQFPRRKDWINHAQQTHWKEFQCPFGCLDVFVSMDNCERHVTQRHLASASDQDLTALLKECARSVQFPGGLECPLCQQPLGSMVLYKRHVGRHQEQLALFALPSQDEQDPDEHENENEPPNETEDESSSAVSSYDTPTTDKAAIMNRLRQLGQVEERRFFQEELIEIPMSQSQYNKTVKQLARTAIDMRKILRGLGKWYGINSDNERARDFFRRRLTLLTQFADGETMEQPKKVLSLDGAYLQASSELFESMARDNARNSRRSQSIINGNIISPRDGEDTQLHE